MEGYPGIPLRHFDPSYSAEDNPNARHQRADLVYWELEYPYDDPVDYRGLDEKLIDYGAPDGGK